MIPRLLVAFAFLLLVIGPTGATENRPILVELFTSQGCSSCPPADALLRELSRRPGILTLAFHVDYWDRLGWKDPFSSPAATARQKRYARLLGTGTIYTPQMVIDGRFEAIGSDRAAVEAAIAKARQEPATLTVSLAVANGKARIEIAGQEAKPATVLLVGFDTRHETQVGAGENDGRRLVDVDAVRGIAEVGRFAGQSATIEAAIPWQSDRLAAVLQTEDGRVLGLAVSPSSQPTPGAPGGGETRGAEGNGQSPHSPSSLKPG